MTSDHTKTHRPADAEVSEALHAAAQVLDELALERPLGPDAEHARDLCRDLLDRMQKAEKESTLDAAIQKAATHERDREETKKSIDREH